MELFAKDYKDISRYYGNTYVKMPQFGEKIFKVSRVEKDSVLLTDREGELFKIHLAEEDEPPFVFEYILPHKAVFFWKGTVYRLYRKPARQYYRGCCSENTVIAEAFSGRSASIGFESLQAFVEKPQYFSLEDALKINNKRIVGVPLTKRISFSCVDQVLFVDSRPIAVVRKASQEVQLFGGQSIFAPEVQALLEQSKLTYKVFDENRKPL